MRQGRALYTLQTAAQRRKQHQCRGKIACAVHKIEWDAGHPVRHAAGRPGHKGVRHGVQRPIAKAEDAAQQRPQQHRTVFARKARQQNEKRPDVQLREPPQPEPVQQIQPKVVSLKPDDDERIIERPNEKTVPKFIEKLKNLGKRND